MRQRTRSTRTTDKEKAGINRRQQGKISKRTMEVGKGSKIVSEGKYYPEKRYSGHRNGVYRSNETKKL